jgi:hypothetical protein
LRSQTTFSWILDLFYIRTFFVCNLKLTTVTNCCNEINSIKMKNLFYNFFK